MQEQIQFNLIYKTINLVNNKIYVGKHTQYGTSAFDGYLGSGILISKAIMKYGKENFRRDNLEFYETEELAFEKEEFWVEQLSATNLEIGYNISSGGNGWNSKDFQKKWDDPIWKKERLRFLQEMINRIEVNEKMCVSSQRRWADPQQREKHSIIMKQSHQDPEVRSKLSKGVSEYFKDPKTREKQSNSLKKYFSIPENIEKMKKSLKNTNLKYHYFLKDPCGKIWECDNLRGFCREHELNPYSMIAMTDPKRKVYQSKGWQCIIRIPKELWEDEVYRNDILKQIPNIPLRKNEQISLKRKK